MLCGSCKFFTKAQLPVPNEDFQGECKALPKQPIVREGQIQYVYPTMWKYDLCSLYQEMCHSQPAWAQS